MPRFIGFDAHKSYAYVVELRPDKQLQYRVALPGGGVAIVACGRKLLEAIWHMLTHQEPFEEENPKLTERKEQRRQRRLEAARKLLADKEKRRTEQRQ
ncbi:MAG: hypothetical protein HY319_20470, partial [Armatimonadetes bacterium]|nr:hypothetical protein [Armatimonadota bacterium]